MLKFIRGKGQQPTAEQQKLQKELFAFRKTVQHGFPNKPTGLAWDPGLKLVAVGTATGAIKVLGKPGVEFYGHHSSSDHAVTKLVFIPNEGRLVTLCDDNSLHLWEVSGTLLVEVKAIALEGKLKKVSAITVQSNHVLLGTEGGNIYLLKLPAFEMSDTVIYQDVVMQNVSEDYKINPGAVEAIEEQPGSPDVLIIGYNRGLMVLWNRVEAAPVKTYICNQDLESICWHESEKKFMSSHTDGSYAYWNVDSTDGPIEQPTTVYGPFPCKAIPKILYRTAYQEPHDELLIFSGGMPRASYSDRHTITVQRGSKKHVVFDFTSKIIDFFTINAPLDEKGVIALIVLAEEEIVGIDLKNEDWPMLNLPYLVSLHASAVLFSTHLSDVPQPLWNDIIAVGKMQTQGLYSDAEWPINGGVLEEEKGGVHHRDLLLTGHEDGSVRFWDAGGVALIPLYTFKSSQLFRSEEDAISTNGDVNEEEDEWPPFKKVGCFDPYSDDPRLAVKKASLCAVSGTLAVAGTAGHVIVAKLSLLASESAKIKVSSVNLVSDRDTFVWKGHEKLALKGSVENNITSVSLPAGFQPYSVLQLHPPAAITALALHADWNLVAAGTAHGLALYNFATHTPVLSKCTLNPNSLSVVGDAPISRRKSFKKSLRESFRRLRKGRNSTRQTPEKRVIPPPVTPVQADRRSNDSGGLSVIQVEAKPVERAVEARPTDDGLGSMVRCLYFADSYIISMQHTTPTLWAGTNNGTVYIFTITLPPPSKRNDEKILCQLGKEIQLRHRAPVIGISIVDGANKPLPEPFEVEKGLCKPVDISAPHRVIIGSEEQFKVFTLPSLKPLCKLKLTATEGARIRRMSLASFSTPHHAETCLLCLTNLGDCIVLSVPDLRRQINAAVIRREDINGISSLAFTRHGEGLYLHSSSELQRVTVSASRITVPHCSLNLPRPTSNSPVLKNSPPTPTPTTPTPTPVLSNGIPEEDEDEEEEEHAEGEETEKKEVKENDGDVTDITIDSVVIHLAKCEMETTTTEVDKEETTSNKVGKAPLAKIEDLEMEIAS